MNRLIDEVEFVIFDTETTGLEFQKGDRIVEVAAIRFKGDVQLDSFHSLINSGQPVSEAAFNVNKITPLMLSQSPPPDSVIPKFREFISGCCLMSYNIGFDLGFLNNELKILNQIQLEGIYVVDILKMARRIIPGLERYPLWFVAKELGISFQQEHRAFSDVELALKVFYKLKDIMRSKGILELEKLLCLASIDLSTIESINSKKIIEIQEAINLKLELKIKYLSGSGAQISDRKVAPKEIKQENGRSYLVGYCYLRREERSFRIDSILDLETIHENKASS